MKFFSRLFPSSQPRPRTPDWVVIGLGNPGPKYAATRHNIGYLVADQLLSEAPFGTGSYTKPQVRTLSIADQEVAVLRSQTYMNDSGKALQEYSDFLGQRPDRLIVIHDELDLPLGKVRVKAGGNENGHNGLKSISAILGTRDYVRVRIGISRPPAGQAVPEYVLEPFPADAPVAALVELGAQAVQLLIASGLSKAQNVIHAQS